MGETVSGRTDISFTNELASIILMYFTLRACHGQISVGGSLVFKATRRHVVYQANVVT
jgi:hypothetical protein